MLPFARITIIGLGLIGSSLARAIRAEMPTVRVTGHDADPAVRDIARRIDLCDDVTDTAGASVTDADLVVLCVPVRAMGAAAAGMLANAVAGASAGVARRRSTKVKISSIVTSLRLAKPETMVAIAVSLRFCLGGTLGMKQLPC